MSIGIKDVFQVERKVKKTLEETLKKKKLIFGVMVRVSTDRQALEGDSLEMQQELAQEMAQEKDGIIYDYYIEDGLSASKTRIEDRTEVQRLKQDIVDGKINCVIAYKRDRMFRNALESMEFFQFLIKHDCELILTARGEMQVNLKDLQGMGQIMEYILATFAQMESATTSARVSDTMITIALKGERTGGILPIGYQYREEFIEPIPEAIPLIQTVEQMYLDGVGRNSIAKWLNGGEIKDYPILPYPVPKPRSQKTKRASEEWNTSNIETILFNPIYTGHTSYQSKKNEELDRIIVRSDKIKPIRTMERQKEINDLAYKKRATKKPPRAYNTPFLLTGLLVCGECGGQYKTFTSQNKNGIRHSYYRCCNKYATAKAETCKKSKSFRKEVIEAIILDVIKKTLSNFLENDTYEIFQKKVEQIKSQENQELEVLDKKIKEKQDEFDNITKIVSQISNTTLQLQYIQSQEKILIDLNELKEARSILSEKLDLDTEESYDFAKFLELAKEFGSIVEYASVGVKKMLLEGFLNQIVVDSKGDIKLDLGIGVAKKTQDTIIGLDTMGEPSMLKDIIVSSDNNDIITINYYSVLKNLYNKACNALYPFLQYKEPRFAYDNFDMINDEEIVNYIKPIHYSQIRSKKVHAYIQQTLDVSKSERERIIYGHLPNLDRLKEILNKIDTNIEEFIEYIDTRHSGFLNGGKEVFEEIMKSAKGKSTKGKYLFEDIIECENCGSKYGGIKNTASVRYRCKNNRADKGDARCISSSINESLLVEQFESDTGEKIRRQDLIWKVEKIIANEDGSFKILYKQKKFPL